MTVRFAKLLQNRTTSPASAPDRRPGVFAGDYKDMNTRTALVASAAMGLVLSAGFGVFSCANVRDEANNKRLAARVADTRGRECFMLRWRQAGCFD